MATDRQDQEPAGFDVLQPTGFGVADLMVSREQDALTEGDEPAPEPLPDEVDVTASGAE